MKNYSRLTWMIAALLTLAGCDQQSKSAPEASNSAASTTTDTGPTVVKIGQVSPMSGPISHLGKDNEYGAILAIEDLNKEGVTIGDKKVSFELVSEDDQGDPKIATQVAQRLVDAHVAGVVGHLNSGTTIPASKIYSDAGIPQISPSATNPDYTKQGYKTAFRVIANDVQQGRALGNYAVDGAHAKRFAVIDDRTAYGQGLADQFVLAVKSKGGQIVSRQFTTNSATDFTAILTNIKSQNPDMVFYGGMDAQAGPMARQMQRLNLGKNVKLIAGDGVQTLEFIKLAGDAAEGHYASMAGRSRDKMPKFKEFNKKFVERFKAQIQIYAPYEYDAVRVLVDAMKHANSADPKVYLSALAKTSYDGVTGHIAFDDKGDVKNGTVTVYQVKKGQWQVVSSVGGDH